MSSPETKVRVLVVDDHPLLREGVASLVDRTADLAICGEAASGEEAVEKHASLRPDLTVMDLQMPGMGGIEAILAIRRTSPDARFVVLTSFGSDVLARRAANAGAGAVVLKEAARKELLGAIRAVHQGSVDVGKTARGPVSVPSPGSPLSAREREVLALMADGNTNRFIARALDISEETVKTHLANLRHKLGAHDRAHAVALAHAMALNERLADRGRAADDDASR